ncbi:hypothetical protein J5226_10425 [Lysobacter sp. K5869]|uniref:hypothetical protein n=1 Tax=Lysobacter sp. K5869 TaxID=2820808 RepID=UPI001C060B2B|nr:hypothetical protein [Lysobacter sp. K5869]QWP78774.1 hypothetical protein J5226_10425 [Lysobacter sp. K5869]
MAAEAVTAAATAPLRIALSLRELVAEFLDHGRLVSTEAFGLDPGWDLDTALAHGWQRAGLEPGAAEQLEREVALRHRGGWRPLTVKPFYLRGRYLGASVALWPGLPLAQALAWVAARAPAAKIEWFRFDGADQGAALLDGRVGLHFRRRGRRFFLDGLDASLPAPADDPDLPGGLDNGRWLRSLMAPCDRWPEWRAAAAQDPHPRAAAQALREIALHLPRR